MKLLRNLTIGLALATVAAPVIASTLIVVAARGGTLKPGQKIDSNRPISLKAGEQVTLIGPDGKTITLRGQYNGLPIKAGTAAASPGQALAALVSARKARTSSVGVVRGAADAAPLPQPWLIDISRPGERCLQMGERPIWWRPQSAAAQKFTVLPLDRSWRADFEWKAGQQSIVAPALAKFDGPTMFVIRVGQQDFPININPVPAGIDNDFMLASWMLEKGCYQQADAMLRQVEAAQGAAR